MKNVLELGLELKNDLREKGLSIDDNFVVKVFSNSIEFILDEDGKRVFGGEVNVTINLMCMALNNWEEFAESCEFAMDTMERMLAIENGDI